MTGSELIKTIEILGAENMTILIGRDDTSLMLVNARIKKGAVDMLELSTDMVIQG